MCPSDSSPNGAQSTHEALEHATALHQQGRLTEAERVYAQMLEREPGQFVPLHRMAIVALQQGRLDEALRRVEAALRVDPGAESALMNKGTILVALGRYDAALAVYGDVLAVDPASADAHFNIGNALVAAGRPAEAAESFARAVALRPNDPEVLRRHAGALAQAGRLDDAIESLDRAIGLEPAALNLHHERAGILMQLGRYREAVAAYHGVLALHAGDTVAMNNRGLALIELGRPDEALASFDGAIAIKPHDLDLWYNRGNALSKLDRIDAALESYDRVLAVNPEHARALVNRANLLHMSGRADEAVDCYRRALDVVPDDAAAHTNMGNALRELRRLDEALAAHERALAIEPSLVEALVNRGIALKELDRVEEAVASYERALAIEGGNAEALYNKGLALAILDRHEQAHACHEAALRSKPDHRHALGALADAALQTCHWEAMESLRGEIEGGIRDGRAIITPFTLLGYSDSPDLQLQCSRQYIADRFRHAPPPLWQGTMKPRQKLRIAYLSADFQQHATSFLLAELLELHDRHRFEVIGVSWGKNDGSATRTRLGKAVDRFLDVGALGDLDVARRLRGEEVAIAIDLKGLTGNNRLGIFAHRPAPVQVGYLGYPATVGSTFLDYVLADPVVLRFDQQEHWTERIVHLPHCYQANDRQRPHPSPTETRAALGLPDTGFVFCCLSNNWKITAPVFDIWMRLLRDTPGSVLWLLDDNAGAKRNLAREAQARGVDAQRLVFAARAMPETHLARHRFADLFLDTLPCNAHTTASDALWMGVPVLTCLGQAFAGRVAGSLLHAVGLPELVTHSLEDYEAMARRLVAEPATLQGLETRLEAGRLTAPLFDSARLCRHIEAAYLEMWETHRRGEGPRGFAVRDVAGAK
jgi:protein O-GlcNAc transferase